MRRIAVAISIVVGLVGVLALAAPAAQAATSCKQYYAYPNPEWAGFPSKGKLCIAPSDDYPNYKGPLGIQTPVCGSPNYFPPDRGVPVVSGPTCTALATNLTGYKWNGTAWTAYTYGRAPSADNRFYVYPFATGWRWVWTSTTGWFAVRSAQISLLWFVEESYVGGGATGGTNVSSGPWITINFT